jgi:hypothetical protein
MRVLAGGDVSGNEGGKLMFLFRTLSINIYKSHALYPSLTRLSEIYIVAIIPQYSLISVMGFQVFAALHIAPQKSSSFFWFFYIHALFPVQYEIFDVTILEFLGE